MKSDIESSLSTSTVIANLSLQSKDVQSLPQKQKIIDFSLPSGNVGCKRIIKEFKSLQEEPEPNWSVELYDVDNFHKWKLMLQGPAGSPYENGYFQLTILFPQDFPFKPPNVFFNTAIFHPNITSKGSICMDIIVSEWKPTLSIRYILKEILKLLIDPNLEQYMSPEAAFYAKTDSKKFDAKAIEWTQKFTIDKAESTSSKESSRSTSPVLSSTEEGVNEDTSQISHTEAINTKQNLHIHQKPLAKRLASADVVFYSGEFREEIPIITQCLQVDDNIAAVTTGIRREGALLNQAAIADFIAAEIEDKASTDDSMIALHCVYQYTSPTFLNTSINDFLRQEDSSKVETLGPFVKLLFSHFKKFPLKKQNMTVYRDLELDRLQIHDYKQCAGKGTFRWLGFSSTSKQQRVAEHFKGNTLMIIRLKQFYPNDDGRAADIEALSRFPQEEEVLLRAGVEFSIEKVNRENGKYYIYIDAYV